MGADVTAEGPGAAAVGKVLDAVVAGMGIDARVLVGPGPEGTDIEASVNGEGTAALIGRGGETIDSLQYLLGQIASRAEGGSRRRVSLDADGYRARRQKALEDLAHQAAREAVEHGEEIELDAMTPHDRRIVHMALKDRTEVITRSEGEEPRRRIIVEPAE